jgi:hypothetical protein
MVNIKVTYESTSRRLNIFSTTTWSELENQFHNLFNIPKEIPITVTYTDEEGDVITLSSDLELQEVLSYSSNNTVKFVLTTSNMINNLNYNNLIDRERSIDTVIDDEETSNLINGVSAIQIEDQNNNKTVPEYKHVTVTEEVEDPFFSQQQYLSQETLGENSKSAVKSTNARENNSSIEGNQENNNDDDEPKIIVIIARNPWSRRRRERLGGCNPYYPLHIFGGRSHRGCHFDETQQGYNDSGCNRTASSRGYGCSRYYHKRQQISSEVIAEKINILHSMGFFNDNLEKNMMEILN